MTLRLVPLRGPPAVGTLETMKHAFLEARAALDGLLADGASVARAERLVAMVTECFRAGGKLMICGNGGSACDAMHCAEEFTGRFRKDRRALPAMALADVGHITCTANDYGFEYVFSRQIEALGKPGDVLIVLSTSGNSPNLLRAVEAAAARGLQTAGLLGKDGGKLRGRCGVEIVVPGATSDRIQELHMLILHALVEGVEAALFSEPHGR